MLNLVKKLRTTITQTASYEKELFFVGTDKDSPLSKKADPSPTCHLKRYVVTFSDDDYNFTEDDNETNIPDSLNSAIKEEDSSQSIVSQNVSVQKFLKNVFLMNGRYLPIEFIGVGGYGVIISAKDEVTGEKVAIKQIRNVFLQSVNFQKRILRETMLLKHFKVHPNLITLYDLPPSYTDFNKFRDIYIVTDLMSMDLFDLMSDTNNTHKFDADDIPYILYQIINGVNYIHKHTVVHRDVKPGNILLKYDDENKYYKVKICDFGISKEIRPDVTMTEYVCTRYYRSPEILLQWDKQIPSCDVWSIGCIFAEMLLSVFDDKKDPEKRILFKGKDWLNQLDLILKVTGTPQGEINYACEDAKEYVSNLRMDNEIKKIDFRTLIENNSKISAEAIDLLEKFLLFNPFKRINLDDALKHKYFTEVRKKLNYKKIDKKKIKEFDFPSSIYKSPEAIKKNFFTLINKWNKERMKYNKIFYKKQTLKI